MVNNQYILQECALGFALYRVKEAEGITIDALSKSVSNYSTFSQMVQMTSFVPFADQEEALNSMNQISEGLIPDSLMLFLKTSIPDLAGTKKELKKSGKLISLGIADANLGNAILDHFDNLKSKKEKLFSCRCDDLTFELIRGCRQHLGQFIKAQTGDSGAFDVSNVEHSNIALAHSYSRAKIKYNVNREDNMIIQAICILDQIDKDINTYCMRCKEWYGWHFPELTKVCTEFDIDQIQYARILKAIKSKKNLKCLFDEDDADTPQATAMRKALMDAVNGDETVVEAIVNVAKTSMGVEVSPVDMVQMGVFATRIVALADFRKELYQYLMERMDSCAPNLTALMGEQIGARLIAKAGSLIKLAKYPASTLQILGAEKALFRALKSKGACATPKYGLIYNSWAITAAQGKAKGKISRVLANKASMATRLDCFMDKRTNAYGKAFRQQVEDRLTFIKDGTVPPKNVDVMTKVAMQLAIDDDDSEDEQFGPATKKKKKKEEVDSSSDEDSDMEEVKEKKKKKKDKKDKKKKKRKLEEDEEEEQPKKKKRKKDADEDEDGSTKKKKKKKDKKSSKKKKKSKE